jgi:hypothetical protein
MKRGKYLISGLMLAALVITGLWTTAGTGAKQPYVQQWEYANYFTSAIPGAQRVYKWGTPYEYVAEIYEFNDRDSELKFWQRVGFKFGNKNMFASDWLNFLGHQGWELVSVTRNTNSDTIEYWFKRPKQ